MSEQEQAQYLHENRAWNWQWPQNGNRWATGSQARKGDPTTRYTSTGPSKRTAARRRSRNRSKSERRAAI